MVSDELILKVMADTREAVRELTGLTRSATEAKSSGMDLQSTFAKMRDVMMGPVAVFKQVASAITGIWDESQKLFDAYAEGETSVLRFNMAMETSDKLYTGAADRIEAVIQKIKQQTYYGDDLLRSQAALLASYGRTEEEITKVLRVASDLAAATGEDLPSAVNKLNMTYNGNIGRMGAVYSGLKDLTAEQLAAGDAVTLLGSKFEGAAEKMSNSAAGLKKNIQDAFDDMREDVGEFLAQFETPMLKATLAAAEAQLNAQAFGKIVEAMRKKEGEYLVANKATTLAILDYQMKIVDAAVADNQERIKALNAERSIADKLGDHERLRVAIGKHAQEYAQYEGELRKYGIENHSTYVQLVALRKNLAEMAEREAKAAEAMAKDSKAQAEAEAARAASAAKSREEAEWEKKFQEDLAILLEQTSGRVADISGGGGIAERAAQGYIKPIEEAVSIVEELGGALGTANDHMAKLNAQAATFGKAMGGGMLAAPEVTGEKVLGRVDNAQFDWKETGPDEFDMFPPEYVDRIKEARDEARLLAKVEAEAAEIMRDRVHSYTLVAQYSGQAAEQIESLAAEASREAAENARALAEWTAEWGSQLEQVAMGALAQTVSMLDKANAVGWADAAADFDSYMVRLVDQLPMMLLTAGLQVMPFNWALGVALIAASGLVALVDIATTSQAEIDAYSSSTGGRRGGDSFTVNYNIEGSVWQDRALEAAAVDANRRAGRGW